LPSLEYLSSLTRPEVRRASGWRGVLGGAIDLLFPPFCPVCSARLDDHRRDPLCPVCWAQLERIEGPVCQGCGLPMPALEPCVAGGRLRSDRICGGCRADQRRPFDYARSATRYGEVVREALHALKFRGERRLANPLGDLVAGVAAAIAPAPDVLVPVPLHRGRERERGFNQAALIARRLGRAWHVPVRLDVLRRVSATRAQTELSSSERRANVRGVMTTGATVRECARCLREGGASTVGVLTVARAV
jgi:predicted amidophosphoribosyltransferase